MLQFHGFGQVTIKTLSLRPLPVFLGAVASQRHQVGSGGGRFLAQAAVFAHSIW